MKGQNIHESEKCKHVKSLCEVMGILFYIAIKISPIKVRQLTEDSEAWRPEGPETSGTYTDVDLRLR